MSELLTIGDAARVIGVSVDTLRRWEREGKMTPRRTPGGQRRYTRDELAKVTTSHVGSDNSHTDGSAA